MSSSSFPESPPDSPRSSSDLPTTHLLSEPATSTPLTPSSITRRLCTSHLLSTWNSRIFEFGAILFLVACFPDTLLPVSVYALGRGIAVFCLAPALGVLVDSGDRLAVVRASILGQRLAVLVSCAVFLALYASAPPSGPGHSLARAAPASAPRLALLALSIPLACAEKLCATLTTLAVERDWVVVVTVAQPGFRAALNARMRQIDLACKLAGPLIVALLDSYAGTTAAVLATAASSALAVAPEYFLIARVYVVDPRLQRAGPVQWRALGTEVRAALGRPVVSASGYFSHTACLPSLALALLYLTVLSFAGQMVAFLRGAGFSSAQVGLARVASSLFELSATVAGPRLVRAIGPIRAGIWCLSWQTGWLGLGLAWFFARGEGGVVGLVIGVIVSRVGLWGYDLAGQMIVQEEVAEHQRGAFSATEAALQNFFELVAFATTAVFHQPDQFAIPATISFAAVATSCLLYAQFVRKRRGHLFHAPQCIKARDPGLRLAATEV